MAVDLIRVPPKVVNLDAAKSIDLATTSVTINYVDGTADVFTAAADVDALIWFFTTRVSDLVLERAQNPNT